MDSRACAPICSRSPLLSLSRSPLLPLHLRHRSVKPSAAPPQPICRNPKGGGDSFVDDPRNWSRSINSEIDRPYGFNDDNDEDKDRDDEEDRNLDLLVRFVQNVFKKVSKQDRRAVVGVEGIS